MSQIPKKLLHDFIPPHSTDLQRVLYTFARTFSTFVKISTVSFHSQTCKDASFNPKQTVCCRFRDQYWTQDNKASGRSGDSCCHVCGLYANLAIFWTKFHTRVPCFILYVIASRPIMVMSSFTHFPGSYVTTVWKCLGNPKNWWENVLWVQMTSRRSQPETCFSRLRDLYWNQYNNAFDYACKYSFHGLGISGSGFSCFWTKLCTFVSCLVPEVTHVDSVFLTLWSPVVWDPTGPFGRKNI